MSEKMIIRVRDVMRSGHSLVNSRDSVRDVLDKVINDDNHIVVVDKKSPDDEYGLVRLSDIAHKVLAQNKSPDRVNVYEIMSKPALCIAESMDIRYCAMMFENFKLHAAPVVDSRGEIVGAISYEDLVLKGLMQLSDDIQT
ncbi:MAG: CBS domain-containing protein [Thiolinea sp.]